MEVEDDPDPQPSVATDSTSTSTPSSVSSRRKSKKIENSQSNVSEVNKAISRLENLSNELCEEDEFAKFGAHVAAKLREMSQIGALELQEQIIRYLMVSPPMRVSPPIS